MCWPLEILNAWKMLSTGVLIVYWYLCQSDRFYNLAQSPFLGKWELEKVQSFSLPDRQILEKTGFVRLQAHFPGSIIVCSHWCSLLAPPGTWWIAIFLQHPATVIFWPPASNCYGIFSSLSAKMSIGNMYCFIGTFLWSKIWVPRIRSVICQ